MASDPQAVVLSYMKAFEAKDEKKSRSYLHDQGLYKGPLNSFDNADTFVKEAMVFMQITKKINIKKVFTDGGDVVVMWDYETLVPSIPVTPIAEWFKVEDGKIRSLHLHFNALPFAEAMKKGEVAAALKTAS
jgi:signal peptidase I